MISITIKFKAGILAIFVCLFSLFGCVPNRNHEFKCNPLLEMYAYPVDQWPNKVPTITPIPLSNDWKPQLDERIFDWSSQILTRGEDQVWILQSKLYLYSVRDQSLKEYSIEWNGEKDTPQALFLAKDGTLYASGFYKAGEKPILNRYNDATDRFESIIDLDSILLMEGPVNGDIEEDSKGRLWLGFSKGVYVFDPKTGVAEKSLPGELQNTLINGEIAIDSKDGVWLGTRLTELDRSVLYYDPGNRQTMLVALPPAESEANNGLLIDSKSRLWVSDYAYRYTDTPFVEEGYSGWNMILRSSVFVTRWSPLFEYKWMRPKPIFEDSTGNIWFSGYGLVRLDPETGEWCRVMESTDPLTGAAEDNQGRIWVVKDGQLYRHD